MDNHVLHKSKRSKLRKLGLLPPALVDARPAERHARRLHNEGGMGMRQIATEANVSMATISELLSGIRCGTQHSGYIRRDISERILSVKLMPHDGPRGAEFPAFGQHRRIKALAAAGYPMTWQSMYLGYKRASWTAVGSLLTNQYTHTSMFNKIDAMYKKLRYVDPTDMGVNPNSSSRSKSFSAKKGWAPPSAWDDDLIDVLEGKPEWTGACGTMQGWQIHYRLKIPMCDRCREAKRRQERKH